VSRGPQVGVVYESACVTIEIGRTFAEQTQPPVDSLLARTGETKMLCAGAGT
jgi:hypothetical protein